MKSEYQEKMKALVEKFAGDVANLAKQMALDALSNALMHSDAKKKPLNLGNFDPALHTQPAVTKAVKVAKKAAKQLAKKTVRKVQKKIAKANKKLTSTAKDQKADKKRDARRAWRLRQALKKGDKLVPDDQTWLDGYNAQNPQLS